MSLIFVLLLLVFPFLLFLLGLQLYVGCFDLLLECVEDAVVDVFHRDLHPSPSRGKTKGRREGEGRDVLP